MQINGYQIQTAIKEAKQRRDIAESRWGGSQSAFADEKFTHPSVHMERMIAAERQTAALQVTQARYNLAVTVTVDGESMTLLQAIKLVGAAARTENLWKSLVDSNENHSWRHGVNVRERQVGVEVSKRLISADEAADAMVTAAAYARRLRGAIAAGNAQFIELDATLD
jgi:hypothetical protein